MKQLRYTAPVPATYFSLGVSISVFILVPQSKLQRIVVLDLLVHHLLTDALKRGGVRVGLQC